MNWTLPTQSGSMGHCVRPGNMSPVDGTRDKASKVPTIFRCFKLENSLKKVSTILRYFKLENS